MKKYLALAALMMLAAADAGAAALAPHRAIYDLSLLRANNNASLTAAEGRLAFELQGSPCEGWTVSFRMVSKYRPQEGQPSLIDTQSTSFEGPGALDFRHQVKEIVNGKVREDSRIKIARAQADAEARGEVTGKTSETFDLPPEVNLPMQHQIKLITLGESGGGGRDSSVVFDGSDGSKSFRAISFVGKTKPPGSIARDLANPEARPLAAVPAWPMTISYYPAEGGDETPEYQVSFDMYANGVATGLVLDYGDFAMTGKLVKLQMLEQPQCP